MEVIGRVEPGAETERTSGTRSRGRMNQEKESRMTLHAVITMEGVYAGFAWSKNLPNCGF